MSIDVEDYFHVSAFEKISPPDRWHEFESRVEQNTDKMLLKRSLRLIVGMNLRVVSSRIRTRSLGF
jgi:hypothetical protein